MSSRFGRLFGRKGTQSKFGQDEDSNKALPQVQIPTTTITSSSSKGKEKETDKTDDTVDKEHEAEDKDKTTNVQTGTAPTKVTDGTIKTKAGTASGSTPAGVYSMLWKSKVDYQLAPIQYTNKAEWIPNFMAFKPLIEECARLVGQSNHAMKHNQTFNPYAFATGMFYLGYIQILRAQKAAGTLIGQDASALARFEKYNPTQGIMIPEPFIPFLEAIVATKLEDAKYKWITPTHGIDFRTTNTLAQLMTPSIEWLIRPNLLFMIMNLTTFGAVRRQDMAQHIDPSRVFTPVDLDRTAGQTTRLINEDLRYDGAWPGASTGAERMNVLQMCGASTAFQFWNDNFLTAHDQMTRSNYFVENGVTLGGNHLILTALGQTNPGPTFSEGFPANTTINSLDKYLFIAKENNPSWFKYITNNINYVARFFKGSKPMSKIATVGGIESAVICQLKLETNKGTAQAPSYVYADLKLGRAARTDVHFYNDAFDAMSASYRTTRADLDRNEELNALCIGINANPPIAGVNADHIRKGRFFTDINAGMQYSEMLSLGFMETSIEGSVPIYSELKDDFVNALFTKKPADV
jgi:hypothetical protein